MCLLVSVDILSKPAPCIIARLLITVTISLNSSISHIVCYICTYVVNVCDTDWLKQRSFDKLVFVVTSNDRCMLHSNRPAVIVYR
jgi:hypothetical protein